MNGFGVVIAGFEVGLDRGDELGHGLEDAATDGLVGDVAETTARPG
jgi:hypothetical protein